MAHVITCDLNTKDLVGTKAEKNERTKLYQSAKKALESCGFVSIQKFVYRYDSDDLACVIRAVDALRDLPESVKRAGLNTVLNHPLTMASLAIGQCTATYGAVSISRSK